MKEGYRRPAICTRLAENRFDGFCWSAAYAQTAQQLLKDHFLFFSLLTIEN
jgi:hypothetical protein